MSLPEKLPEKLPFNPDRPGGYLILRPGGPMQFARMDGPDNPIVFLMTVTEEGTHRVWTSILDATVIFFDYHNTQNPISRGTQKTRAVLQPGRYWVMVYGNTAQNFRLHSRRLNKGEPGYIV